MSKLNRATRRWSTRFHTCLILRPDFESFDRVTGVRIIPRKEDYRIVPVINMRGSYPVRELMSRESVVKLARFANAL